MLSTSSKLSFGIGSAAEGVKNVAFSLFLLFFYVQVHGLSASLAGMALFIALCFDAISDPVAGYISDSWRSRWGRRHPFMYAAAIPLGIAFYFVFTPPEDLGQWALFAWLTGFTILTRAAMTLYYVPHMALGAELSDDYEERTSIVSYRTAFSIFGALAVYGTVGIFFPEGEDGARGQLNNDNYPSFALTCGLVMWLTIWISAGGTHKEIPRLRTSEVKPEPFNFLGVFRETKIALTNKNFRVVFLAVLSSYVMNGVNVALSLFVFTFFWELSAQDMQMVLMIMPFGVLLGIPFTKFIHRRFDKKPAIVFSMAWWAVLQVLPVMLRLVGFFPDNGASELAYILAGIAFLQGVGTSFGTVTVGSMIADIVDEQELVTGRRQEGTFFAALSFSAKATSGLGGLVAGVGLDLINWPQAEAIQSAAKMDPEIITRLGLLFGPLVAFFGIAAIWFYSLYNLDRAKHTAILTELRKKRANTSENNLDDAVAQPV
jgi:GPH family glycoside/pentoside/hexuronide:cation symporter|tara:strand:- start:57096 stop:58559 length:1464 start_codon:yes stop_codon:yes gene_type:complete